jgi:hypothetical protein
VAEILWGNGKSIDAVGLSLLQSLRALGAQCHGGSIDYERTHSTATPLAFYRFYDHGSCQFCRDGAGRATALDSLFAIAAAVLVVVQRVVHVCATLCREMAQSTADRGSRITHGYALLLSLGAADGSHFAAASAAAEELVAAV